MFWKLSLSKMGVFFFVSWNRIPWRGGIFERSFLVDGWGKNYRSLNFKKIGRINCRGDYWGTSLWGDVYFMFPIHYLSSWTKCISRWRFTFKTLSKWSKFELLWWGMFSTHEFYTWYILFPIRLSRSNWNVVRELFRKKVPIAISFTYLELCQWNA